MSSSSSVPTVQFFFGVGSRYSYLAATQIARLEAETKASFEWRALDSRELIERARFDPFRPEVRRGQYDPAYRTRDATRWAAYFGVPYREPEWEGVDWRKLSLACIAAKERGRGEAFALRLLEACFGFGDPPREDRALAAIAAEAGLDGAAFLKDVSSPETAERHRRNLDDAFAAGAFGVPTFVLASGELYWGQDRLPLLRHRLVTGNPIEPAGAGPKPT